MTEHYREVDAQAWLQKHPENWLENCITESGKVLPNLANARIALKALWPNAFAYDEMLCAVLLMRALDGANDFAPI